MGGEIAFRRVYHTRPELIYNGSCPCYNFDENIGVEAFCERIIHKIRKIIIKEKSCIKSNKMYDQFTKKWDKFIYIYDFRGPDLNIV